MYIKLLPSKYITKQASIRSLLILRNQKARWLNVFYKHITAKNVLKLEINPAAGHLLDIA